jgi:hypothetical protein
MISTITATDIERFLAGLSVAPKTWNTIRRDCVTLYKLRDKGRICAGERRQGHRTRERDRPTSGILTPSQAASLLAESKDHDLLAFMQSAFSPACVSPKSRHSTGAT